MQEKTAIVPPPHPKGISPRLLCSFMTAAPFAPLPFALEPELLARVGQKPGLCVGKKKLGRGGKANMLQILKQTCAKLREPSP